MNAQEKDFAYKVRHALNDRLDQLPEHVVERLSSARKVAIASKRKDSPLRVLVRQNAFAGHIGNFFSDPSTYWLSRMSAALALAVLLLGGGEVVRMQEQHRLQEMASMDAAVLADELPPKAYLDPGFKSYLQGEETQ
jgi:hypothetical protein